MTYNWQRWLADEFRAAGLKVVEVQGWENRGRPASTGHFTPNGANTAHHTGTTTSASRTIPTLQMLITGRPDLPGPLCQWAVGYDGTVYVIAAGRANHAGRVGKRGVAGMPYGADGNAFALGNEVDTNGTQALPAAQREAIFKTHAVVLEHFKRRRRFTHRHADISATGKWDIGQLTTRELRVGVAKARRQLKKRRKATPLVTRALGARTNKARRKAMTALTKRGGEARFKRQARRWLRANRNHVKANAARRKAMNTKADVMRRMRSFERKK